MEAAKRIINEKGGTFLELRGRKLNYIKFLCENGHTNSKDIYGFKSSWCKECTKLNPKPGFAKSPTEIAKTSILDRGGTFIEEIKEKCGNNRYKFKIKFICKNGHTTIKHRYSLKTGWCNKCKSLSIDDAHALAEKRNFIFLSDTYTNSKVKYKWKCPEMHTWEASYDNIRNGKGCPECLKVPYTDCILKAKLKGGICLTPEEDYKGVNTKMKWKCKNDHTFSTKFSNIRHKDSWCSKCLQVPYSDCVAYAATKKGKCLTLKEDYRGTVYKIKWQCEYLHVWSASFAGIKTGRSWCPKCSANVSERTCKKIFEFIFKVDFEKIRPDWILNPVSGSNLELDGYNGQLKLAFEYNGAQHYKRVPYWHKTVKDFEDGLYRDKIKKESCIKNDVNLVTIPYTVKYLDLYTFIYEKCIELDYNINGLPKKINYSILNLKSSDCEMIEKIRNHLKENFNCVLTSKTYLGCTKYLKCICELGHESRFTWDGLQRLKSVCKICAVETKRQETQTKITNFCLNVNVKLISGYKHNKAKMTFKCLTCDEHFLNTWNCMRQRKTLFCCYKPIVD
jgi:hypothetical protein